MSDKIILVDWQKCDHLYASIIEHTQFGIETRGGRLGSGGDPSRVSYTDRRTCAICGAIWDSGRQEWRSPMFAKEYEPKNLSHPQTGVEA